MAGRGWVPVLVGTVVAAAVGCAGETSTVVGDRRSPTPTSASVAPSASARSGGAPPVAPARRARSVVVPEAPRTVVLPSGREVDVRAVGTTGSGLLDVPDDIEVAGWWRGGSRLGDPFGATLLAAHVDSRTQGLGPFAELLSVGTGARLRVTGRRLHQAWAIRSRELVPQGTLDDHPELFDPAGARRLLLVTCAPPYVAARGGYQNLAVLTATPVGAPEAP